MLQHVENKAVRNVEAEARVIGAMLCDNKLIDRFADALSPADFFEQLHARMFEVIVREYSKGGSISPVSIQPYFKGDPALQELGGSAYLLQLSGYMAPASALGLIGQLKDLAQRRFLIDSLHDAADFAGDMNNSREDVISAVDAAISPEEGADAGIVQISAHDAFWEMIEEGKNREPGVTAPLIPSLNEAMGPARRHHLVILAGRPGMGKTCAAMSYALSAAQDGHGVLFVSLEMSRIELMQRASSDLIFDGEAGVPYSAIRDDDLTDNARRRLHDVGHNLRDLPFNIVDAGSLTIGRLNMIVRRYKRRMEAKGTPLKLVVVDYLQLVRPDHRASGPVEAVSEVSRGLKAIAKTHDVAVMALAQLNRSVESRDTKRPKLSDLRDSGQIEQDADAVVFLYRDEYYLRLAGPGNDPFTYEQALDACRGEIEFICAKRRNGEASTTKGRFHGAFMAVRG
jgi:replicative DNA helicase